MHFFFLHRDICLNIFLQIVKRNFKEFQEIIENKNDPVSIFKVHLDGKFLVYFDEFPVVIFFLHIS